MLLFTVSDRVEPGWVDASCIPTLFHPYIVCLKVPVSEIFCRESHAKLLKDALGFALACNKSPTVTFIYQGLFTTAGGKTEKKCLQIFQANQHLLHASLWCDSVMSFHLTPFFTFNNTMNQILKDNANNVMSCFSSFI